MAHEPRKPRYRALTLPADEPAEVVVYVVPHRPSPGAFTVLAPLQDRAGFAKRLDRGRLTIRVYEQCEGVPTEAIQEQLLQFVRSQHGAAKTNRVATGVLAGILATATLGSWLAVDPVWLVDELVLPTGAAAGYLGYRFMERRTAWYEIFTERLPEKIADSHVVTCPLLTGLYVKMALWAADQIEEAAIDAEWVRGAIADADADMDDAVELAQALSDHLGLSGLLGRRPSVTDARMRRKRDKIKKLKGVSEAALHTYLMFCQSVMTRDQAAQ